MSDERERAAWRYVVMRGMTESGLRAQYSEDILCKWDTCEGEISITRWFGEGYLNRRQWWELTDQPQELTVGMTY